MTDWYREGAAAEYVAVEAEELARLIDAGVLRPFVGQVFDLADGAKAFGAKQGGGVPGKAVLRVVTKG